LARHDVRSEKIGLLLRIAAEPQECRAEPELRSLGHGAADAPADNRSDHRARQLTDLVLGGLGRLRGAVPQRDVTELVGHHAGSFTFVARRLDHPAIDVHRSAGQRERVDLAHVDHVERIAELGMLELRRDGVDQPPADRCDGRRHLPITQDRKLLRNLHRGLTPDLHVLRHAVAVGRRRDHGLRADHTEREQNRDGCRRDAGKPSPLMKPRHNAPPHTCGWLRGPISCSVS
jgi:hypothetical protein